jgi:hypothetical protein
MQLWNMERELDTRERVKGAPAAPGMAGAGSKGD